jgi:hypothetical protein
MDATMSNRPATIVESLDWLFGQLPEKMTGHVIPAEVFDNIGRGNALPPDVTRPQRLAALANPPSPPPALDSPEGFKAAYEWFLKERARLEDYTREQFADFEALQASQLARHYQSEASLTMRAQEVNREMQFLAAQSQALKARARELADRENALAGQMARFSKAQDELITIQKSSANIELDTEIQQASLEQMRRETAQLQVEEAAARESFAAIEAELAERQRAWEKKQADLAARVQAMEQRYQAMEKAEAAAKRRLAELDDLEDHLREEFESQQRQLVFERQELAGLYAELRERGLALPKPPAILAPSVPERRPVVAKR